MAKLLALFCLLLVGVPSGLTQNASTNSSTTTTTNADGTVTTVTTTTNADGSVTTTTTTEGSINTTATEIDVTVNSTIIYDFSNISNSENFMTLQQLISAGNAIFEGIKSEKTAKLNAILSTLKDVQSTLSNVATNIGPGIVNDLFFEGTSKGLFLAAFLKRKNPTLTSSEEKDILNFAVEAGTTFKNCISSNTDANNIATTIASVSQEVVKLATADAAFKIAVAKCAVGPINQILQCANNAATTALSSTSTIADNVLNTKALTENVYKCFDEAASRVRQLGNQVYSSFNSLLSAGDRFILPSQFDSGTKNIASIPTFVYPSADIAAVKTLVSDTKKIVTQVVNSKAAGLAAAKAMLEPSLNESLGILSRLPTDSMTNKCILAAQQRLESDFVSKAQGILKCIAAVPSPPTLQEVLTWETSLLEREQQEKLFLSLARCASSLRNAFDTKKLQCCITEAQADLTLFVDGIKSNLETSVKKTNLIKSWIQSCAVSGVTAFEKQVYNDFTILDKCYKQNVKVTIERPKENPYVEG